MKVRILMLTNATLLCFLGLWDLFSEKLPDLNSSGLLTVFPRVYHIVVSALLLFLYPMLNTKHKFWFLIGFAISAMVTISSAAQLFSGSSRIISLSVIFISNLVMNGTALYFLMIKNSK
jgi:hypothetical protein